MINKHTANRFMGAPKMPVTTNPLILAQYAKKNVAAAKHQDDLQADFLIKAIRDSAKPLVTSVKSSNNTLATILSKDVAANETQVRYTRALVDATEKAYRAPSPALMKTLQSNTEVSRIIAKGINDNVDLVTRTATVHTLERKEDLAFLQAEKRRDTLRNDILAKIEQYLNPRKLGLFDKLFSGMKFVGGAVVGGAAVGVGKMVKAILTGQAFQLAGASVVGISRFFSDTVKFVAKPLGLTNAAGSKVYFGSLVKKLPLIGTFIKGIYSTFDALSTFADDGKVGALLNMKPEDLQISDKVAAALGTFLKDMSFGLTDYLAKTLGFENTQRMIKAGFDKAKDLVPMLGAISDTVVNWTTGAITASADFIKAEVKKFQQADSTAAYVKDAGKRLAVATTEIATAVGGYLSTSLTAATVAVKDFFRTEDVTPDGTVLQRYMTPKEVIDKLSAISSSVATKIGQTFGALVSGTIGMATTMLDSVFKVEDVTPDGTVLQRYLSPREIADKMSALTVQVATGVMTSVNNALTGMFTADGAAADVRLPQDKLRDFVRQGFDIVSKGVNVTILAAYDLAAKAIGSMFEKNDGPYTESMLSVVIQEIASGTVRVFTSAVSTLANRLVESVTSEEFLNNARDVIHSITSSIFAPLAQAALVLNKLPILNAAPDVLVEMGKGMMRWNEGIQAITFQWRSFSKVVTGIQEMVDTTTGAVTSVMRVTKNVEETFIITKKIADFFDGVGALAMKVGGGLKFMGNVAQFVSKWAWPIQAIVSIFDFLDGFSEEVASGRLGIDPSQLKFGDKLGSGIGSIVKGLADLPLTLINWLGRQIFGDGFNVGSGEDMAKYVAKNIHQITEIISGNGSVGDVAAVLFKGMTGVPFAIGAAILRNVFGFEVKSLDEISDGIKTWVDETVGKVKNINFGEVIAQALGGIGDWLGSIFSVENLKKMVIGSLQRIPGGQTILEWAGVIGPQVAPTVGASQTPAAQANTMAVVKPQYDKWEQDKIRAAEKNDVATIEKIEKQQAELLKRSGLKADSQGNLIPDTSNQPAPPVYQALGGAWDHGKITRYALGGVPDIVSQPTLVPTGGGNHALIAEAGYPEGILPLQRMRDGKLGVHAVMPPWPRQIDFKNVTFNLDSDSGKSFAEQLADAWTKASSALSGLASGAVNGVQNFVQNLTGGSKPQGPIQIPQDTLQSIANTAAQATGADPNRILSALTQAQSQANTGFGQAQAHVNNLLDSGKSALNSLGSNPTLNNAGTSVSNFVSNGLDKTKAVAATGIDMVNNGVKGAVSGIDQFMAKTRIAESGGKDNAVSDTGATGRYQFTKGTWNDITTKYADRLKELGIDNPRLASKNSKANPNLNDPRYDVKAQEAYMRILTENNAKQMGTDDPGALYLAHFMGAGSAKKIVQASMNGNGSANALSLLSKESQDHLTSGGTNNSIMQGKSADQIMAWARKKMNATGEMVMNGANATGQAVSSAASSVGSAANNAWNSATSTAQEIKNRITGPDGSTNWTADTAASYFGKLHGFGADATSIVASIMAGGDVKAASNASALKGGRGNPTESYNDFARYSNGKSLLPSADLASKQAAMMRLGQANPAMLNRLMKSAPVPTTVANGPPVKLQPAQGPMLREQFNTSTANTVTAPVADPYVKVQAGQQTVGSTGTQTVVKPVAAPATGVSAGDFLVNKFKASEAAATPVGTQTVVKPVDAPAPVGAGNYLANRFKANEQYSGLPKMGEGAIVGYRGGAMTPQAEAEIRYSGLPTSGEGSVVGFRGAGVAQMQAPPVEKTSSGPSAGSYLANRFSASAQMETPKAINPTYGDKVESTANAIRAATTNDPVSTGAKNSPPSAAQSAQSPGPTNDGPSIDAIPMTINDMGLIVVNSWML